MSQGTQQWRNPAPTVDIIIEIDDGAGIVLIERDNPPHGWALPGGFVDEGESVEAAAIREAAEETQLQVTLTELLYVYSNPARDPRQHTMSTVFIGRAQGRPRGADDAARAEVFSLDALPEQLCFDHAEILADYRRFLEEGQRPAPQTKLARNTPDASH